MAMTNAERQSRYRDAIKEKAGALDGTAQKIAETIFATLDVRKAKKVCRLLDQRLKAIKADCRACAGTGRMRMGIFTACGMPTEMYITSPCDCGPDAARHVAAAEARAQQPAAVTCEVT